MGTIAASVLIGKAGLITQDVSGVRWLPAEMIGWLNDGQNEVVIFKPEACVKNIAVLLTASATKQALPADGVRLTRVSRNMGAAGTTPGGAIRIVDRAMLDSFSPTWHVDANPTAEVREYTYDPLDPKTFYVNPQTPAAALYVELVYNAVPVAMTTASSVIGIDDIYANALLDYVLYRAYSKDAGFAANAQLALAHYTAFYNLVTGKTGVEQSHNPNQLTGGQNQSVPRPN